MPARRAGLAELPRPASSVLFCLQVQGFAGLESASFRLDRDSVRDSASLLNLAYPHLSDSEIALRKSGQDWERWPHDIQQAEFSRLLSLPQLGSTAQWSCTALCGSSAAANVGKIPRSRGCQG